MKGTPGQATLFERDGELQEIAAAAASVAAGDGALLVVAGLAGIGKSRLLDEARTTAEQRGLTVLRARGGELERDFAYGVMRQLLERSVRDAPDRERQSLLAGAAGWAAPALGLPEPVEGAAGDTSFAVAHGLYWLVSNVAASGPLLLCVDDAHWADAPSLRALLYLSARLEGLAVLLVLAVRPGEPDTEAGLLQRIAAEPAARTLRPRPLSPAAVSELASMSLEAPAAPEFAEGCHRSTGGNPFLLRELLNALKADGVAPTAAAAHRLRGLGPETVSRSLLLRLARLPAGCAELARAVAVLGARAEAAHAAALAGVTPEAAGEAADALAAVEILSPGRLLSFVHPVVREAIYAELPASQRATMHAAAAEVLAGTGAPPDTLAPHLLATEPAADPATVETLRQAARRALGQSAPDIAQRYLRRALAEPPAPELRADVLAELGTAEFLAGEDRVGAVDHLQEALRGTTDPTIRAERLLTLSRAVFLAGDVPGAYDTLEGEVSRLAGADTEAVKRLEAELGSLGVLHPPTSRRASERAARLPEVEGTTPAELVLLSNLAHWEWFSGSAARAGELAERSHGGGRLLAAHGGDTMAVYQSAWILAYADRLDLAMEILDGTLADARARGSAFAFAASCTIRAMVLLRAGDLRSAEAEIRNTIALEPPPPHPASRCHLTHVLVERGALEEADAEMEGCGCGPDLPELVHINPVFYARGRLRLAQGRPQEALEDFEEVGRRDERLGIRNPGVPWRCGAVEAHLALGHDEQAARLAEEHDELAQRWGTLSALGVALRARGLAAGEAGQGLLREAANVLERSPSRLDHAHALVDLGAATRRAGRRAEAREPLRAGLDAARRCGATALVERAHAELVTAGARPRRLMFSGLEALTASERRVAQMAACGQSNREIAQALFVTVKTVENHLGHGYNKLGIGSRSQLPGALDESQPDVSQG